MENHKQRVNQGHHSSRTRGTGFCLQTSMSLTMNMNVKVAVELYYIFSKISKFGISKIGAFHLIILDSGNFSLTLSI